MNIPSSSRISIPLDRMVWISDCIVCVWAERTTTKQTNKPISNIFCILKIVLTIWTQDLMRDNFSTNNGLLPWFISRSPTIFPYPKSEKKQDNGQALIPDQINSQRPTINIHQLICKISTSGSPQNLQMYRVSTKNVLLDESFLPRYLLCNLWQPA